MSSLESELLFEFEFDTGMDPDAGEPGPNGLRMAATMTDGWFKGPKLNGRLAEGGIDWMHVRNDGAGAANVRCKLVTDNGAAIYASYNGYFHPMDPAVIERVMTGVAEPSEYYLRVTPYFETTAEGYDWLNRIVAVAVGRMGPGLSEGRARVHYDVYEIK